MLAVIKTGGKQYLVSPNDKIKIEKIDKKEGEKIIFDKVLLFSKEDKIEIGKPFIKNRKVIAEVIKQGKGKKIIILKFYLLRKNESIYIISNSKHFSFWL